MYAKFWIALKYYERGSFMEHPNWLARATRDAGNLKWSAVVGATHPGLADRWAREYPQLFSDNISWMTVVDRRRRRS